MVLQSTQYTCGPCAVLNALLALGVEGETERTISRLAGTSPIHGTNAAGLRRALSSLRYKSRPMSYGQPGRAAKGLLRALREGHPVLLLVDQDEHWVTAIGVVGERVVIADSGSDFLVTTWSLDELARKWVGSGKRPVYYAIEVVP